MESANLRHLQHQPPSVDTSLSTPPCYGIDGSTHSWSPQFSLNAGNLKNQILQEAASRSRDSSQKNETGVMSMIPDEGYKQYHQWASDDAESCLSSTTQSTHDLGPQFSNKKEEMCYSVAFPKFTEMLDTGWSSREHDHLKGVSEKLFLDTLSSGDVYSTAGGFGAPNRGKFSQIHPTINISNLNHSPQPPPFSTSSSINMNMQYLHLLRSPTLCGDDSSLSLHMQNHIHRSSNNSSNPSNFTSGVAETKRSNALMESKPYQPQTASKKIRPESRSSCPPLKVRKEKLGDRIAALQQLVAPFGKTDTASVLMEAIGYIKFLQNQVETLSVPYMKSSRNQNNRVMQGGSGKDGAGEIPKRDLRSRGLCLVPLSCMSYITGDHAPTAMWNQPNFGGPT